MGDPQRWRLVLEYHGGRFVGWQRQPHGLSVQQVVEEALEALLGEQVHVRASGRTDAGVHALGQVAAFTTRVSRSAKSVRDGLTGFLPPEVACVSAEAVALDFDPRRDQRRKTYRYTWLDRRSRSPLWADRAWHWRRGPLDDRAMDRAVQALVGDHHFDSFRAVGCAARHTWRTLEEARVSRAGSLVHLDLVGTGFLRHMVRIVAGTVAEVGAGKVGEDHLARVLAARDRRLAGRTAPPHGLTLVSVVYDPDAASPREEDPSRGWGLHPQAIRRTDPSPLG